MKTSYRVTLLTSVGSALEYYDFVIYIMLAGVLSEQFFPPHQLYASWLETLGVFAVGYLARPIGGVFFGSWGDRKGRKNTFLTTILLMALSTFAIGLLPTYQQIGVLSPCLLVALRLLQGLSQGGELAGAITFISEHADQRRRGLHCNLMMFGVGLGASLSSFMIAVLTHGMPASHFQAYGWRIPFLVGGVLAVIAYVLRKKTMETPLFETLQATQRAIRPFLEVLRNYPLRVLQGIGLVLFPGCLIIFALFLPHYLAQYYPYQTTQVYFPLTVSLLMSAFLLPIFGSWSDVLTRKVLMLFAIFLALVCLFGLFALPRHGTTWSLWAFLLGYEGLIALLAANYPAMLAELFPTAVRYTGVAVCYNVTYSLAGFTPLVASMLSHYFNSPHAVVWALLGLAMVSLFATWRIGDRTREAL